MEVLTAHTNALGDILKSLGIEHHCIGHRQFAYNDGGSFVKKICRFLGKPIIYIRYKIANFNAIKKAEEKVDFSTVDIIHSNVDRNDVGAILAKQNKIPHIWHLREHTKGHFDLKFNHLFPFKYMNRYTTKFIAISESVKMEWIERGLDEKKICRIYDGDDLDKYYNTISILKKNQINIVFVGRISKAKGQFQILRVLSKMDQSTRELYHVDFWGDGSKAYINKLKKFSKKNGLERYVRFCGFTRHLPEILKKYDIGLNCSQREGFGRITIEYMAAGLCVIAKDEGANKEIVENNVTGLLYENDIDLEKLLVSVIKDRETLRRIALSGQKKAFHDFNLRKNLTEIHKLYMECMK